MTSQPKQLLSNAVDAVGVSGLVACSILVVVACRILYNIFLHPLRKYPGPLVCAATPLVRFAHVLAGHENRWLLEQHRRHGHVVRVGPDELSYTSAASWQDIYGQGSKLAGRKWLGVYNPEIPQLQTMQLASDVEHPRLRRIFSKAFSEAALREQQPLLKMYAERLVRRLREACVDTDEQHQARKVTRMDMTAMYGFFAFDFMGDMAFGQEMHMIEDGKMIVWLRKHFESLKLGTVFQLGVYFRFLQPLMNLLMWAAKDAIWASYRIVSGYVEKRLAMEGGDDRRDIWGFVQRDQEYGKGRKLSQHEMSTHGLLFIFAGTETTATLLTGLTYLLLTHPDKMAKLKEEIRSAFPSTDDMNMTSLQELPYLHDCIEEAFRLYPPVPVGLPRITPPEGAVIDGKFVPPNTVAYTSQYSAYRMESNFRNPDDFIPERWSSPEYASDNKAVLQPFLVGPRNCIGKPLAYHEIRLVTAYMLWHFDLELANPNQKWIEEQKLFLLWEKTPLMINVTPREVEI